MKNTNKKGFTLVELVIVIAVIAILAAVLIPTFTSVINRANQSAALQKIKAIVDEKYIEYVADNHEVPTSVKVTVTDNKFVSIEFGADKTNANTYQDFTKLENGLCLALNSVEGQKVYFVWATNGGYSVVTAGDITTETETVGPHS